MCKQQMGIEIRTFFPFLASMLYLNHISIPYAHVQLREHPRVSPSQHAIEIKAALYLTQHYQLVKKDSPYTKILHKLVADLFVTVTMRPASNLLNCKLLRSSACLPSFSSTEAIC